VFPITWVLRWVTVLLFEYIRAGAPMQVHVLRLDLSDASVSRWLGCVLVLAGGVCGTPQSSNDGPTIKGCTINCCRANT